MTHPLTHDTRPLEQVNVLGVGVHAVSMERATQFLLDALSIRKRGYVCVACVNSVIEALHDPRLADIFKNALLVTPDGMPLVWIGRGMGHCRMRRVFGPDLMSTLCAQGIAAQTKHFLYGGQPGVAQQLKARLESRFPGIRIVGTCTPPFRPLDITERNELIRTVDDLRPDIIWVGLSTPKQECFMAEYLPLLKTSLMIGVGAAFDFHTGRIKDSPQWVKMCGLQWLHRLLQEPRRLGKRYLLGNSEFLFRLVTQLCGFGPHIETIPGTNLPRTE